MAGKRAATFPAPMSEPLVPFRFGMGSTGSGVISGKRPAAFPASMSVVLMAFRFGIGPTSSGEPSPDVPAGPAARADAAPAEDDVVDEAGGAVTVTVAAAASGVQLVASTLTVAVSVTDVTEVAFDVTGISACI
jgi:hypothetical protein